jgi:hypothetical protein
MGNAEMLRRFVVVPAVPAESGSGRFGESGRYMIRTISSGFNIYDNFDKLRMQTTYSCREAANAECTRLNS